MSDITTKSSAHTITTCNIRWTSPNMDKRGSSNSSALSEAMVDCDELQEEVLKGIIGILYKYRF